MLKDLFWGVNYPFNLRQHTLLLITSISGLLNIIDISHSFFTLNEYFYIDDWRIAHSVSFIFNFCKNNATVIC